MELDRPAALPVL